MPEKETRLEEKLEEETVKNIRNNTTKLYILKNLGMLVQDLSEDIKNRESRAHGKINEDE